MGSTAQLSYSEIRSPLNGVVTDRPLYAGELAAANQPLMTLMDLSKADREGAYLASGSGVIEGGGSRRTCTAAGSDDAIHGRVSLVSPALDPGSTTIEVWVEVREAGSRD